MSRFVHVHYPAQHGGVARVEQAMDTLRGQAAGHALDSLLHALSQIGAPLVRLAGHGRTAFATWREGHRQREEDRKLWNLALTDARVMADLSRAMSQDARSIAGSRYF
jgi:hypothetical protein